MTFIGKILVIVVMAFSLIFLGISTVSLSTAKNWSAAIQKEQTTVTDLKKSWLTPTAQADRPRRCSTMPRAQFEQEKKTLETRLDELSRTRSSAT